jgi:hypothetical protein
MLITLVAAMRVGRRLSHEQLGLVQLKAWQQITGLVDERIGEDILMLSASGHEDFLQGCENAAAFLREMDHAVAILNDEFGAAQQSPFEASHRQASSQASVANRAHVEALWERYFERPLLERQA